jgi:hypothetical protein
MHVQLRCELRKRERLWGAPLRCIGPRIWRAPIMTPVFC